MQANPLDQLADVVVPTEVSAWPPGPAWWVVAAITLLLIFAAGYVLWRRNKHLSAKKEALALAQSLNADGRHTLLKRLTKHYYSVQLSSQSTALWIKTLSQLSGVSFTEDELNQVYQPTLDDPQINNKLLMAIKQFKTKEKHHV